MKLIGKILTAAACVAFAVAGPSVAANAAVENEVAPAVEDGLDPATFEGPMIVATTQGEIVVDVSAGEALLFADRTDGDIASIPAQGRAILGEGSAAKSADAAADTCSGWKMATSGAAGNYLESTQGCAVFGYEGYERPYSYQNESDYTLCVSARTGSNGWEEMGCSGPAGGAADVMVSWGNTLNYTKVKAASIAFPGHYIWFD